jgi:hypothetical protein
VADKYEVSPGVINKDIVEFVPPQKYDLIVSISTLEHVGWNEQPREPTKLLRAIEHLRDRCLEWAGPTKIQSRRKSGTDQTTTVNDRS